MVMLRDFINGGRGLSEKLNEDYRDHCVEFYEGCYERAMNKQPIRIEYEADEPYNWTDGRSYTVYVPERTCRMDTGKGCADWECQSCGCQNMEPVMPDYCPWCGARVVY